MRYLPHTQEDIADMLKKIGAGHAKYQESRCVGRGQRTGQHWSRRPKGNQFSGNRVKSGPLPFSKIIPIAQPNRGLETAVSKEVSYPLHSTQLLHKRFPNVVR